MDNLSSPSPTRAQKSKCFSFWPSRKQSRRKAASKLRISWPSSPDMEPGDRIASENDVVCFTSSSLNTFARCDCGQKTFPQRMLMRPYFGSYAGLFLTFEIKRSSRSSDAMVAVKVMIQPSRAEPRRALTTLYIPRHKRSATNQQEARLQQHLKDRCITFAHDIQCNPEVTEVANSCKQPQKLFFLCQQQVMLHVGEMNYVQSLPATDRFSFLKTPQVQNIFIRVYFSNPQPEIMLRMKVKPALCLHELKWMICKKLTLDVPPSRLELYQFDHLSVLSSDCVLQPNQSLLHCVIQTPSVISHGTSQPQHTEEQVFVVSVIGKDIGSVSAKPSTTLHQFQDMIKSKFNLKPNSFIYFPMLGKTVQSESCGIKMSTIVDKSTINLIDSMRRNLPIVQGVPLAMSKYEKIPVYSRSISSLGMSSPGPVIVFEVTGPTIPLSFRAVRDQVDSEFTVVSDRVHALSVNPKWTTNTLLKYVECISRLPCVSICLGSSVLPISCQINSYLTCRCWLEQSSSNLLSLAKDIACVTHS